MATDLADSALDLAPAHACAVIDRIFSAAAVRAGASAIFDRAASGSTHFKLCLNRLDEVANYTIAVTRANYPELKVPYHARHGHLRVGGVDRPAQLAARLHAEGPDETLRSMIDLVVVSVLLDAGAGNRWTYQEPSTRRAYPRSEGLAVASFDMFMAGSFSGDAAVPLRADIGGLRALTVADLERGFQVSDSNPLIGATGRVGLLHGLAESMARQPDLFPRGRIADLLDHVIGEGRPRAAHILDFLLRRFGDIWPQRLEIGGYNLGDVWIYPPLGESVGNLIPFHKLSQWLTYSLIVPLMESGYAVGGIEELTGLAEYRNGGLMLDCGLIELRDPALSTRTHDPASELIIEWRALTVALLDLIAERVRCRLGMNSSQMPLAAVLEGGTWSAGRRIAHEKRLTGEPPLRIASDGTIF